MNTRTITAIFDSATDAERARAQLLELGLSDSEVRIVNQPTHGADRKGLWESIKDLFVPDEERATYAEGLRRGGYLLTASVDEARADEAIAILETSDAVDLDERSEQWRSEGWTGAAYTDSDAGYTNPAGTAVDREREEAIPIVRERLRVGKREVNRGGVRVRSYIVEEPVNQQVDLREERVEVERRPVGRAATTRDASDLLQERTIELTESAEEAVVAKDAEVTEEVVVRKFEGHRTEGVSDTVRRTEVEVEDTRVDTDVPPSKRGTLRKKPSTDSKPTR